MMERRSSLIGTDSPGRSGTVLGSTRVSSGATVTFPFPPVFS